MCDVSGYPFPVRAPIPCGFRQPTQKQVSSPLGILKGCRLTTESSQGGTWTQTAEQKWSGTETLLTVKTETGMVLLLGGSFGPAPNRWGGEQLHPPAPRMLQESCPPSQLLGPLRRGRGGRYGNRSRCPARGDIWIKGFGPFPKRF